MSITRGVVSRIEHDAYAHSSIELLAVQIDAAINSGNSGGPVLTDHSISGVVMQYLPDSENIGYMVPAPVVRHRAKKKKAVYHRAKSSKKSSKRTRHRKSKATSAKK